MANYNAGKGWTLPEGYYGEEDQKKKKYDQTGEW
jgi:hypothetical protein